MGINGLADEQPRRPDDLGDDVVAERQREGEDRTRNEARQRQREYDPPKSLAGGRAEVGRRLDQISNALGLSQVHGFIKQSGGHIMIYSEIGQGTTVKLYLPRLVKDVQEREDAPAHGDPVPRSKERQLVLVAEDEEAVRRGTVSMLEELGYAVLEAESGVEALEKIDSHPEIALLITDVVMPGMNGRQLADEAAKRRPDLRVLFSTGYTRNAIVHHGTLDPGVHLINKPFTLGTLARKIMTLLGPQD